MSYGVPKMYGLNASVDAVPLSLGSSTLNRPIPSSVRTISIVSQSGNQNANGFHTFQIPTGAGTGFIRPNSMYLRCRINTTGAHANWSFNNPSHSASAIIRSLTVSLGNQVVEQIQHYGILHDELLLHTTSRNYLDGDSAILEYSSEVAANILVGSSVDVCIPIISGLFCGQKAVPAFLLSSPIMLQVDYESLNNAIIGNIVGATNYTVSNAQLIMDVINVDDSYKQAVKMSLADPQNPKLYQLNVNQFLNGKVSKSNSTTLTYNIGTSMSSVKGVLYTISTDPAAANVQRWFFTRDFGATSDFNVLLDGQKVNNMQISDYPTAYAEMNKVFGNLFDPSITFALSESEGAAAPQPLSAGKYLSNGFLGGVSTNRFNENMAMCGLPAANIQFSLTTAGSEGVNDMVYYFVVYETILTIDANGNATLIR